MLRCRRCRCRRARNLVGQVLQWRGSIFPQSFAIAMPCALCTAAIRVAMDHGYWTSVDLLKNSAIWNGFTFLVGFLIFFRTSQAYQRFWDGCTAVHTMRLEWFEACSSLLSYSRHSTSTAAQTESFQHLLIRIISMLHASALAEIEDSSTDVERVEAFRYPLLDVRAIDRESLQTLMQSEDKVGLLLQWIQQLIVDHMTTGVLAIPAPLLTHAFHQLFNGVLAFHSAIKIASIPFPYSQMCDILLVMQSLGTPIVTAQWVDTPLAGAIFGFLLVFVYWCLNMIATDIENPFGHDSNDIDGEVMQQEMNRSLLLLLEPSTKRTPQLRNGRESVQDDSLLDVWRLDACVDEEIMSKPPSKHVHGRREVVFREPSHKARQKARQRSAPKNLSTLKRSATLERVDELMEMGGTPESEMTASEAESQPFTPSGSVGGLPRNVFAARTASPATSSSRLSECLADPALSTAAPLSAAALSSPTSASFARSIARGQSGARVCEPDAGGAWPPSSPSCPPTPSYPSRGPPGLCGGKAVAAEDSWPATSSCPQELAPLEELPSLCSDSEPPGCQEGDAAQLSGAEFPYVDVVVRQASQRSDGPSEEGGYDAGPPKVFAAEQPPRLELQPQPCGSAWQETAAFFLRRVS